MTLPVSFEFFPPKTPEGAEKLRAVRQKLYALKPEFCSVTYGAGGSTQEGTFATVAEIIVASALRRPESRGLHCNRDHPDPDPRWNLVDTRVVRSD